jgi:hypothetical protein
MGEKSIKNGALKGGEKKGKTGQVKKNLKNWGRTELTNLLSAN